MITPDRATAKARAMFDQFIKKHECYEGQMCAGTLTFRKNLQVPILKMIKDLEEQAE